MITPKYKRRLSHPDHESWDGDFESGENKGTTESYSLSKRTRHNAYLESNDEGNKDEKVELGFADEGEHRTLTTRSKSRPSPKFSPPPVPALPQSLFGLGIEPSFPRPPSASVFSVPMTTTSIAGHNSLRMYMSTSDIPLQNRSFLTATLTHVRYLHS